MASKEKCNSAGGGGYLCKFIDESQLDDLFMLHFSLLAIKFIIQYPIPHLKSNTLGSYMAVEYGSRMQTMSESRLSSPAIPTS